MQAAIWLQIKRLLSAPRQDPQSVIQERLLAARLRSLVHIEARISDATRAEERRSTKLPGEALFSVSLDGLPVRAVDGSVARHLVDALAGCGRGEIEYLMVRIGGFGGIAETLHRLPRSNVSVRDSALHTARRLEEFEGLAAVVQ